MNVYAVKYIAQAAEKIAAQFIHLSTDFIFDGTHGPLKEEEIPQPLSYYGKSKYLVEQDFISKGFQVLKPGLLIDKNLDFDKYNAASLLTQFSKYNPGFVLNNDINLQIGRAHV